MHARALTHAHTSSATDVRGTARAAALNHTLMMGGVRRGRKGERGKQFKHMLNAIRDITAISDEKHQRRRVVV